MSTYLVTGGAGFIGSHLVEALVQRGDKVRVLDNLSTGYSDNLRPYSEVEFIEGDVVDPVAVKKAVSGVEVVFHQAALASVPRSLERPLDTHHACVTGTLNVLHQAQQAGVRRVVYAASSSAYGDQPYSSKREQDLACAAFAVCRGEIGGRVLPAGLLAFLWIGDGRDSLF